MLTTLSACFGSVAYLAPPAPLRSALANSSGVLAVSAAGYLRASNVVTSAYASSGVANSRYESLEPSTLS